ncbi:MAG: cupin domain-containing protein [Candidatus Omnitrophota bacterium]
MKPKTNNLFQEISGQLSQEIFDTLLETENFRLERIVSQGQSTPPGEWLEQKQDEWVVLLSGAARLLFAQDKTQLNMKPGDYVHVPANCKHRVEWTEPNTKTVWLTLHYENK